MELVEIYILCKNRSRSLVLAFLEQFLPCREETADDYPYPEYVDPPEYVYDNYNELLGALERDKNESYSLYWDAAEDDEVRCAMVFYTEDAHMIAGITVASGQEKVWLDKLSACLDGEFGYVGFDEPPPETRSEFINLCKSTNQIKMISGKLAPN